MSSKKPSKAAAKFEIVESVMRDERLIALRQRADEGIFLWEDLDGCELPAGFDKAQTWSLLTLIRRQTAIMLPWQTFMDKGYSSIMWYSATRGLTERLEKIEALSYGDSPLWLDLQAYRGTAFAADLLVSDLEAALAACGVDLPKSRIWELTEGAEAASPADRIVLNWLNIDSRVQEFTGRKMTPGFIEELHYQLTLGVEDYKPEEPVIYPMYAESIYRDSYVCLKTICSICEDEFDKMLHPAMRAIAVQWFFSICRPLPSWNALIEMLVRHIFFAKSSYPLLSQVPLQQLTLAWLKERSSHRSPDDFKRHLPEFEDDSTAWFLIFLDLFLDGLDQIAGLMQHARDVDERLEELLVGDDINYRQRAILVNAIRNPGEGQKIEPHRRRYRVAYATARADFLDLSRRGFLEMQERGRAFVFVLGPKLAPLVSDTKR